jgi:hypothetical protein
MNHHPTYLLQVIKSITNIMLDDRAGLSAAYKILYETKERIKNEAF